jgi:hypothetical protein
VHASLDIGVFLSIHFHGLHGSFLDGPAMC